MRPTDCQHLFHVEHGNEIRCTDCGEVLYVREPVSASALDDQVGGNHYTDLAIQPAEYCQRNRLPYCESSVVRYVTRHRGKNGREDLEKAIHCLRLLIEMEYPENDQAQAPQPATENHENTN